MSDARNLLSMLTLGPSIGCEGPHAPPVAQSPLTQVQRSFTSDVFSYAFMKRAFDVGALVSLAPLLALIVTTVGILIRTTSRGPVFYSQRRIGRDGRTFRIWKFRSMCVDSDEVLAAHLATNPEALKEWEATQKLQLDPRVTVLGQFLRRTSLDELPQIWNVLKGDMSLVGPRPITVDEIPKYGASFKHYCSVKPGITGLWQVSGRSHLSYPARVELDERYATTWNFVEDLRIIVATFRTVLLQEGAF